MFDDGGLAAAGHEDELFDSRLARFIHRVLDQRPVDDGKKFLRDSLCCGKKAGSKSCYREYGFSDGLFELWCRHR